MASLFTLLCTVCMLAAAATCSVSVISDTRATAAPPSPPAVACRTDDPVYIPAVRTPPSKRLVNSTIIEAVIANVTRRMKDKQLATLFENCFPNTLDTTAVKSTFNDSFVITGDIDAMWMRDATNQVLPYVPYLSQDPALVELFTGLVRRELRSMIISTYADAWNEGPNGNCVEKSDFRKPPITPNIFEGKYELDQLCAVIKVTYETWTQLRHTKDDIFLTKTTVDLFVEASMVMLQTMVNQTASTKEQDGHPPYEFRRDQWPWKHPNISTVYPRNPVSRTGMIRSGFRPSDDETIYDFLLPSNVMVLVEVKHLQEMVVALWDAASIPFAIFVELDSTATKILDEVAVGIEEYASFNTTEAKSGSGDEEGVVKTMSYEVDGMGNHNNMDDANVPSLLSLPWLFSSSKDAAGSSFMHLYNATRRWILSEKNPWYFNGTCGAGIGSPHTGENRIWPMSVMMRVMTSDSDDEIERQFELLKRTANTTGFMHESFYINNVTNFTRPWFAWANTMFGQMVLHVAETRPHLIFEEV